jgi:hypothetical protein
MVQDAQPAPPVVPEQAVAVGVAEPPARKEWFFVKNMNPKERIRLPDGEVFQFPSQVFYTKDPILAAKITQVASTYRIVLQDQS